jgi:outer membrane protein assembly factor BamB
MRKAALTVPLPLTVSLRRRWNLVWTAAAAALGLASLASAAEIEVRWKTPLVADLATWKPREYAAPVASADGKRVWLGSATGVAALDAATGRVLWRVAMSDPVVGQPALVELPGDPSATLYVSTLAGAVYAFEPATGKPRWSGPARLDLPVRSPLAADQRFVFLVADPASVHAIDRFTGKPSWRWSTSVDREYLVEGQGGATVYGSMVLAGTPTGKLVALSARDGAILWDATLEDRQKSPYGDVDSTPLVLIGPGGKPMAVATSHSGGLCAVALDDGRLLWRYPVEGLGQPIATPDGIAAVSALGEIHIVDLRGQLKIARRLHTPVAGNAAWLGNGLMMVPSELGLDVVRTSDLRILQRLAGEYGWTSEPIAAGPLWIGMNNGGAVYGLAVRADGGGWTLPTSP